MHRTINESQIERHQQQQNRLNSKLNERLEYSDVYFNRDSQGFFKHLSVCDQKQLLERLKLIYSQILFDYFSPENNTNSLIDRFVEEAFFVNLPMNKVVEIHLELIENLERQLRFEGLHIDYLSDFRLTLIDVIAHLGEMYRSVICEKCLQD
ncbi:MAG: hypothetical protein KME09_04735 [Pleurocapsa minor HA4230-MV1]|jgi:circadian clock protein KaiA|nr:hypothetical protein [Pleurocapsa minor HA4230-MV1]